MRTTQLEGFGASKRLENSEQKKRKTEKNATSKEQNNKTEKRSNRRGRSFGKENKLTAQIQVRVDNHEEKKVRGGSSVLGEAEYLVSGKKIAVKCRFGPRFTEV